MRAIRSPPALALLVALLASDGAEVAGPPPAPPAPPSAPLALALEAEIAGCSAVLAGLICELPRDGTLRVWVKVPEGARLEATADASPLPVDGAPIQGGLRLRLEVPAGARALVVAAARGEARAERRWALRPFQPDAALDEAEDLRQRGALDEAARRLDALRSDPDPARRTRALGKLARIDLARGDIDAAVLRLEQTIPAHLALGRISDAFHDSFAEAYTLLLRRRELAEARRVLDRLDPHAEADPEGHVRRAYYAGLLSYEAGDLRATLERFRASVEGAERLGLDEQRLDVLQLEALVLQELGRGAEGEVLLREVEEAFPPDARPCRRAAMLTNVGWFGVQQLARGDRPAPAREGVIAPLQQALALRRGACPSPDERANVLTNLALAELFGGDLERASRHLDEARRERPDPDARVAVWLLDVEGRIALGRGEPAHALGIYRRMADLAASGAFPGSRVHAALGRAEALGALGRVAEARAAYVEAEALLGDQSLLVPLGEGRESFLGQAEEGARRQVDFLLRHDVKAAAMAARRSRARALAALRSRLRVEALGPEERARWEAAVSEYRREREALDREARGDWKLAADALASARAERRAREAQVEAALERALSLLGRPEANGAPPAASGAPPAASGGDGALPPLDPGELLLVFHPIREGWAAFAVTAEDVAARRLPPVTASAPVAELSRVLLEPLRGPIEAARRIRFAPYGELDRVDFHALPWKGEPLVAHAPVAYAVDLPGRRGRSSPRTEAGVPLALVVADPRHDLPAARREADAVAEALGAAGGFRVARLSGDQATHGAVRGLLELPEARLFHYAGHGFFGGRDGWESGLPLSQGGWLTVRDVLALAQVPAHVVLSGCDTARTAPEARAAGLGLGQAFVVAGAESVIAAVRPIDDRMAERLMGALYNTSHASPTSRASPESAPFDAARSLREAALTMRAEFFTLDWASLRVLVP
ncbi:CHAT domain-containing protein [Sorangium sp. So ce131]|uniref:CHAT domain-containing protein n=1 Tax=Sorangium sp. So ce131 TaxID=3133282 RepID=UPI003F5DEC2F